MAAVSAPETPQLPLENAETAIEAVVGGASSEETPSATLDSTDLQPTISETPFSESLPLPLENNEKAIDAGRADIDVVKSANPVPITDPRTTSSAFDARPTPSTQIEADVPKGDADVSKIDAESDLVKAATLVPTPADAQQTSTSTSTAPYVPFVDVELPERRGTYILKELDPTAPREPVPLPKPQPELAPDGTTVVRRTRLHMFAQDPGTIDVDLEDEKNMGKLALESIMARNEGKQLNPYETFRHMMTRRWQRFQTGEYAASRTKGTLWTLFFAFVALLFIATAVVQGVATARGLANYDTEAAQTSIQNWALGVLIIVVLPWVIMGQNTSEMIRAMFLTIDIWVLATFIMNLVFSLRGVNPADYNKDPSYRTASTVLAAFGIAALIIELTIYLVFQRLLPWMLETGRIDDTMTKWLFALEPVDHRTQWTWKYRTREGLSKVSRYITYRGEIHPQTSKPHGIGEWLDDAIQGEAFFGDWVDGVPTAPFNSTVYSSGSAFQATRIGFYRNNHAPWITGNFEPRRDPNGAAIGVAGVEVSVAGKFQKNLPDVKMIMEPTYVTAEATSRMMRNLGAEIVNTKCDECVIYTHGLWTTCEQALDDMGQFRSLGGYPKDIRWFVFDWPSGWYPFATFFTVRKMSKTQEVREDLRDFVRLLTKQGFKKFHFLGHSMGCRVTCHLTNFMTELFQPIAESGLPIDPALPVLGSVTLIHGEMDLVDFISIKYPILRQYTNLITAYTDSADQALKLAETLTGRLMMGKNPGAFFVDPFSKSKDVEGQFDVVEEARVEYLGLLTLREKGVVRKGTLKKRTPSETLLIEEIRSAQLAHLREDAPGSMEMVQIPSKGQLAEDSVVDAVSEETPEFKRNTSKRKVDQLKAEHVKMWLDMDVIDNSFLDTNTSAVRHSIFVLNRSLIDDIQDIILHGKRAERRGQRLLRRIGNVYYFLSAPSFIGQ